MIVEIRLEQLCVVHETIGKVQRESMLWLFVEERRVRFFGGAQMRDAKVLVAIVIARLRRIGFGMVELLYIVYSFQRNKRELVKLYH